MAVKMERGSSSTLTPRPRLSWIGCPQASRIDIFCKHTKGLVQSGFCQEWENSISYVEMCTFSVSLLTEKASPLEEKYTQRTMVCRFVSKDKHKSLWKM